MAAVYSGQKRWYFLRAALVVTWVATAYIGFSGFFLRHDFLTVPILSMDLGAGWLDMGLAGLCFILPLFLFIPKSKFQERLLIVVVIAYLALCFLDINRLQSYMTIYFALMAILFIAHPRNRMQLMLIVLVGTYFYSGLQKLNPDFAQFTGRIFWFYSSPVPYSPAIGYGFAIAEILLGLLLLWKWARKYACILLLVMHALILWKIGPFKANWNHIVWPWNLMMMGVLGVVAFAPAIPKPKIPFTYDSGLKRLWKYRRLQIMLLLFFWILPPLNFLDLYPNNLSFHLYTGDDLDGKIAIDTSEWNKTDIERYSPYDLQPEENELYLKLVFLSLEQRGIAIYAEEWVYNRIYNDFCNSHPGCMELTYRRKQPVDGM